MAGNRNLGLFLPGLGPPLVSIAESAILTSLTQKFQCSKALSLDGLTRFWVVAADIMQIQTPEKDE
jgi:hypothetical protein